MYLLEAKICGDYEYFTVFNQKCVSLVLVSLDIWHDPTFAIGIEFLVFKYLGSTSCFISNVK